VNQSVAALARFNGYMRTHARAHTHTHAHARAHTHTRRDSLFYATEDDFIGKENNERRDRFIQRFSTVSPRYDA